MNARLPCLVDGMVHGGQVAKMIVAKVLGWMLDEMPKGMLTDYSIPR